MAINQGDFEDILADDSKEISGDISWRDDLGHSESQEFRAEVRSESGHSMFIHGRYTPLASKLSYTLVHKGEGRIYGLDLGANHRNPDRVLVGRKHKHRWREGEGAKWAYVPEDITEPWCHPVEVWRQFCDEANLRHSGIMDQPASEEGDDD